MKSFIKIVATFLLLFFIGLFITYISINNTFKKVDKTHLVYSTSNSILYNTHQII